MPTNPYQAYQKFYVCLLQIGILATLLSACRIHKPLAFNEKGKHLPPNFTIIDNSGSSIAHLNYKTFFKDQQLIRLIDTALSRNYDLKIYDRMLANARLQFEIMQRNRLPQLQLNLRSSGDRYGKYTMTGVGNYDTNLSERVDEDRRVNEKFTPDYYGAIASSWEIDIWNKLQNLKKAEQAAYLATEEGRRFLQTQIITEVASLYFEIQAQDDEMEAILANIKLQQDALNVVIELKKAGRANELAVKQFEAQLYNTQSLYNQVLVERQKFINQLKMLTGILIEPLKVDENLFLRAMDTTLALGNIDDLLANRPDLRRQKRKLEEQQYRLYVAAAERYPALTLNAYAGFNAFNAAFFLAPASFVYGLLAGLATPVYQQKRLSKQLRISENNVWMQLLEYQKLQQQAYIEVETHLFEIENYRRQTQLKEQEVNTLIKAVDISDQLFMNGYAGYLEVIVARRDVLRSQLELIVATKDRKIARLNLYRALGGGVN